MLRLLGEAIPASRRLISGKSVDAADTSDIEVIGLPNATPDMRVVSGFCFTGRMVSGAAGQILRQAMNHALNHCRTDPA